MATTPDTVGHPLPWRQTSFLSISAAVVVIDAAGNRVCVADDPAAAKRIVVSVNRYAAAYPNCLKEKTA